MKKIQGKKAFIAGIADDKGYGWAIAKELANLGAEIIIGTFVPLLTIFNKSLENGKLDTKLEDGTDLKISAIFPLDASFDKPEEIPKEILENKRYKDLENYSVKEVAELVEKKFGKIDYLVHSLGGAPEIKNSLLETSRLGYLQAIAASSYSFLSLVKNFAPNMNRNGAILNLSYVAANKIVPGYGGGMSSSKAALESDTKTLAYEVGRKYGLRVNSISAGPLASRAAKAIGFIDHMVEYSEKNAPLQKVLKAAHIAKVAAFLLSEDSECITASTIYADNGLHAMAALPIIH
jgi:enoyl-[acyl-carrier protein] reductase I